MHTTVSDVFFDLDHTLWDFDRNSALAFVTVFDTLGVSVDLDAFLEAYLPVNYAFWERYRNDEITHDELRYGRFRKSFDLIGYEIDDDTVKRVSAAYIRFLPSNNHLFDGAKEILDYLGEKYRLHIITNGFDEVQRLKLENSGIGRYFTTVTNSEMAGVKKPNPAIFEFALTQAGTSKERSMMIGDCIESDVRGALNCGFDAIHFCTDPEIRHDGIKKISSLKELKMYL